jgi:hypothetical protein
MHADFAVYETDPMDAEDPRELRPVLTTGAEAMDRLFKARASA